MRGENYIQRILAYAPTAGSGSPFLDAVAKLPFDGHDAKGAAAIAREGLDAVAATDPHRPVLQRVVDFVRENGRPSGSTMRGILFLCREQEAALTLHA